MRDDRKAQAVPEGRAKPVADPHELAAAVEKAARLEAKNRSLRESLFYSRLLISAFLAAGFVYWASVTYGTPAMTVFWAITRVVLIAVMGSAALFLMGIGILFAVGSNVFGLGTLLGRAFQGRRQDPPR